MLRASGCLLGVLLLLSGASASGAPRKRAVLVLVNGMSAEAFFAGRDPVLSQCAIGLMNAQSPTPVDVLSSYATVASGSRVRFDPGDGQSAGSKGQALSAVLSESKRQGAYLGPAESGAQPWSGRPARLLGEFRAEVGSCGPDAVAPARELLEKVDFLVYDRPEPSCGPGFAFLGELLPHLDPHNDLVILTSPAPGSTSHRQWSRLAGIAIWGSPWAGRGLTSTTTRTPGLVANVDIAPTLLAHLGIPTPPSMDGHPIRPEGPADLTRTLAFARDRASVRILMTPVLLAWGALALGVCALAVGLLLAPKSRPGLLRAAQVLLAAPLCVAAAMLLTAATPVTVPSLLTSLVLWSAAALLASVLLARTRAAPPDDRNLSPVLTAFSFLAAIILVDLYLRFGLLQKNLMSDFPNIGSRFYGIGNEWEGMLLGTTLLLPFIFAEARSPAHPRTHPFTLLLWSVTLIGVAAPRMGADFGGAVTLTLAYVVAATVVAAPPAEGKRAWRRLLAAMGVAGAVAAGVVALDVLRPAGSRTHVGELAVRALEGEWRPALEMVGRKAALNVETALSPFTLAGLAAVSPLLWLCYHRLGARVRTLFDHRPSFRAGLLSVLVGGVLGLVLNDTGVVTWAIATGCALVALLDALLSERLGEQVSENPP